MAKKSKPKFLTFQGERFFFGWERNPDAVARYLSQLQKPLFSGAAPNLNGTGTGKDVFFWEAEQVVVGKLLAPWDQGQIGSCVAHGSGRAAQDLLIVQSALTSYALKHKPKVVVPPKEECKPKLKVAEGWEGHEVSREALYAGCRVQVGGQKGDYTDGAVGAWAAQWLNKWGIVLAEKYSSVDLSNYDGDRCRQWGGDGCPDDIAIIAKQHPIGTTALITTVQNAQDALANGYPISLCGSLGRTMSRQPGGWCTVEGSWAHCQELCGVCTVKGGTPAFVYRNSWGDYLGSTNNLVSLESGRDITLPSGCYLSDFDSVASELKQQDSFAYSHATGWPSQSLTWLI